MGWACSTNLEKRYEHRQPWHSRVDDAEMGYRHVGCGSMDWVDVTQGG
jgi:hypothetical protein